jgi:hypothetical protein
MASTAAEFALFLEPKLSNIWHNAFPTQESKYSRVMNVRDMNKNTITDAKLAGFGPMQSQPDGDTVTYDDPISPITKTYTYSVRALGYKVHERLWMNDLYGEVEKFEEDLKDSAADDVETSGAALFNSAFTTTNTGFDGLALCSTSHTRMDGGTVQANRPSTDEALSLSALHNSIITIHKWKNDRGRPRVHKPKTLLVPSDLIITAQELLSAELKPETALNTKNVLGRFGIDSVLEWEHLTSTTAWFIVCDKHDVNFFWRYRTKSGTETDFDTETMKRKVRHAYATGFGEWRGIYGTDGVA